MYSTQIHYTLATYILVLCRMVTFRQHMEIMFARNGRKVLKHVLGRTLYNE